MSTYSIDELTNENANFQLHALAYFLWREGILELNIVQMEKVRDNIFKDFLNFQLKGEMKGLFNKKRGTEDNK